MKMYKKPIIEVAAVNSEQMMQDFTASVNGGGGGGKTEAPGRRGDIIP